MRFIRKGGRVIPIRDDQGGSVKKDKLKTASKAALLTGGASALVGGELQTRGRRGAVSHANKAVIAARKFGMKSGEYQAEKSLARTSAKILMSGRKFSRVGIAVGLAGIGGLAASAISGKRKKDK